MIKNSKYFEKNYILFFVGIVFTILFVSFIPIICDFTNSNDVKLVCDNNKISISNVLPLTDVSGKILNIDSVDSKILDGLDFSIEGTGNKKKSIDYEIYLVGISLENSINPTYVKVYLTDKKGKPFNLYNTNVVPTYKSLRVSDTKADAKVIYAGSIKGGEKKEFKIRIWLDDSYFISDSKQQFSAIINVRKVS